MDYNKHIQNLGFILILKENKTKKLFKHGIDSLLSSFSLEELQ